MLARQVNARIAEGSPFYSLEFFPPATTKSPLTGSKVDGTRNEIRRYVKALRHLKEGHPLFVDVTWFVRNDPGNLAIPNSSTSIAVLTREECGIENVMLHITCNGFTRARTEHFLRQAMENGVKNVLTLRGDDLKPEQRPPTNGEPTDFWASDLVGWCRQLPDSRRREVTVVVAGNPLGHPLCKDYEKHLLYLKAKVEAGADFIVTQFFLEVAVFEQFVKDCRRVGVQVPILPGILLFKNAIGLQRIAKISDVPIPPRINRIVEANKKNTEAVQNYALQFSFDLCRELLERELTTGIHLFTMNQKRLSGLLLRRLGLWQRLESYEHRCLASPLVVGNAAHEQYVMEQLVEGIKKSKKPTPKPAPKPELLELGPVLIESRLDTKASETKTAERSSLMMSFWLEWLQERPIVKHNAATKLYSAVSTHISCTNIINPLHMR